MNATPQLDCSHMVFLAVLAREGSGAASRSPRHRNQERRAGRKARGGSAKARANLKKIGERAFSIALFVFSLSSSFNHQSPQSLNSHLRVVDGERDGRRLLRRRGRGPRGDRGAGATLGQRHRCRRRRQRRRRANGSGAAEGCCCRCSSAARRRRGGADAAGLHWKRLFSGARRETGDEQRESESLSLETEKGGGKDWSKPNWLSLGEF